MSDINKLETVIARLRAKDGCPWDRVQTHTSLKPCCIEEAAEVICGINILEQTGNGDNLKEELGDLLMQVVMHAQIAEEEGLFTLDDVIDSISEKMIRRHPHVFAGEEQGDHEAHMSRWEAIKAKEKEGKEWMQAYLPEAMDESKQLIEAAKIRKHFV